MTFAFIEPELGRISGGLHYNAELAAASGGRLERHAVAGSWPQPAPEHLQGLDQLVAELRSPDPAKPVLLDGLFASCLPQPVAAPVVVLAHSLAQTEAGRLRESAAFRAAAAVVTPSSFAAAEVSRRYGIEAVVARPGVSERVRARAGLSRAGGHQGHDPRTARTPHFICLGAQEENKNQLFLAQVLRELIRRGCHQWVCTFAGPITETAYAEELRAAVQDLPQVHCCGELSHEGVADLYKNADLLLLPSQAEAYGMVVREAAVAGIPAFVTAGTGAEEAMVVGQALHLDAQVWADALEQWVAHRAEREDMASAAHDARASATRPWAETAGIIVDVLESVS